MEGAERETKIIKIILISASTLWVLNKVKPDFYELVGNAFVPQAGTLSLPVQMWFSDITVPLQLLQCSWMYLKQSSISSNYIIVFVNQFFSHLFDLQLCLLKQSSSPSPYTMFGWLDRIQKRHHTARETIPRLFDGNNWLLVTSVKHDVIFTWRAGADVDHLALGTRHMFVFHHECDRLHKYGVLCPGLQVGKQDSGIWVLVWPQLHIHHIPAVGATAILPLELCDVLVRPVRKMVEGKRFTINL